MRLSGKKVLVTGAGGFIGSHLAEALVREGAKVRAMVRYSSSGSWGFLDSSPVKSEFEVVQSDVCDSGSVDKAVRGSDIVFHLAALIAIPYSYEAPLSYVRTNVEGTLNVLQAARNHNVTRVLHTSTSEVYGTAQYVPIDEKHPVVGQSPYSASKIGADKMAEGYFCSFGLPVVTVRPFNTFGPRQSARAVIPTIITQAIAGDTIRLGSTGPTRDFTFVADTVEGFIRLAVADNVAGKTINLGSGREVTIPDVVTTVGKLLGKNLTTVFDAERVRPAASEVERLLSDFRLATELCGYRPSHTLEEGLGQSISWIKDNLDRYRVGTYQR